MVLNDPPIFSAKWLLGKICLVRQASGVILTKNGFKKNSLCSLDHFFWSGNDVVSENIIFRKFHCWKFIIIEWDSFYTSLLHGFSFRYLPALDFSVSFFEIIENNKGWRFDRTIFSKLIIQKNPNKLMKSW